MYQDNKSEILLEKKGNKSIYKRTKHIKTTYFFITDHIKQGELEFK